MALAMARDIRVILVKLADRLHNMRTLGVLPTAKARRIARETLDIYAPIAMRLGMNSVRMEFEDLGFTALYPMRARRIEAARRAARGNRASWWRRSAPDRGALAQDGHEATVIGREKHLYSIYRRCARRRSPSRRSWTSTRSASSSTPWTAATACSAASTPCTSPYPASSRTTSPSPRPTATSPCTRSPWACTACRSRSRSAPRKWRTWRTTASPRTGCTRPTRSSANGSHARARQWVQGLLEMQQRAGNSLEFIENVKIDLFPDEIYVFTPEGPHHGTAARRHGGGLRLRGAHGAGQQLRRLSHQPPPGTAVRTAAERPDRRGDHRAGRARTPPGSTTRSPPRRAATSATSSSTRRARMPWPWAGACSTSPCAASASTWTSSPARAWPATSTSPASPPSTTCSRTGPGQAPARRGRGPARRRVDTVGPAPQPGSDTPLAIRGTEGFMVSYARCCRPLPGDPIAGLPELGARRGGAPGELSQPRRHCATSPEQWIALRWDDEVSGEYLAELRIEVENRRGTIATIATRINSMGVNIEKISTTDKDYQFTYVDLELHVREPRAPRAYHAPPAQPGRVRASPASATDSAPATPSDTRTPDTVSNRAIIATENAPAAIGPYSQAVKVGNTVWLSGRFPWTRKPWKVAGRHRRRRRSRFFEPRRRGRGRRGHLMTR
jgi:guanosine-3',5'-bis(diphosphate) 3'-pyrophosphohydrolase